MKAQVEAKKLAKLEQQIRDRASFAGETQSFVNLLTSWADIVGALRGKLEWQARRDEDYESSLRQ